MIAVIFEAVPAEGRKDHCFDHAARLKGKLEGIDGFMSVERYQSLVDLLAELHETVVCSHARMLAADLRCHAERLAHVLGADRQGRRCDDDMVELRAGHVRLPSRMLRLGS